MYTITIVSWHMKTLSSSSPSFFNVVVVVELWRPSLALSSQNSSFSFSNEEEESKSPHTQNAEVKSSSTTVCVRLQPNKTRKMTRRTTTADGDESTTPRKPAVRSSKRARRAPKAVYDNDFEAHEIQNVMLHLYAISSVLLLRLFFFSLSLLPLEMMPKRGQQAQQND